MRESRVWAYLDGHLPVDVQVERIEVKLPVGLADCFWHAVVPGVSGWLELKYCEAGDREFRAGRIPKLRPEQPLWLNRKARAGIPSGILLRVGEDAGWMLWIASGRPEWANGVRSAMAVAMADRVWSGRTGPVPFQFRQVFESLLEWRSGWRKGVGYEST